jgi:hypothetical protein
MTDFSTLEGLTLTAIHGAETDSIEIIFETDTGRTFRQHHDQECCENVCVDEIHGDIADLIGTPILLAEEEIFYNEPAPDGKMPEDPDSFTWTFYKLATAKGHVTIKWLGESSGYYSETVDFEEVSE